MARTEIGQAAIDLGPDQGGIGEQLEDPGPDERLVRPNGGWLH